MELCRFIHESIDYCHSLDTAQNPHRFRLHAHEDAEIYCFLSGIGIYHVEGAAYPLSPGDVLIMRPAEAHYIEISAAAPYERISINLPTDLFRTLDAGNVLMEPFFQRKGGTLNRYPQALFKEDLRETVFRKIEQEDDPLALKAYLFVLLSKISRAFHSGEIEDQQPETMEYRIARYINNHLHERLTIKSLSERFYLSPSQLNRRFQKATGSAIAEYINTKRMLRAHALLSEGVRASDAAFCTGFSDYSAFYRAYRKKFGAGPRESFEQHPDEPPATRES